MNDYRKAFEAALAASGSHDEATKTVEPQFQAFQAAEQKATAAMAALTDDGVDEDPETATAIRQLEGDYAAEVTYFRGLVESYPDFLLLFSDKQPLCHGIFVGQNSGFADRRQKLDAAAGRCQVALDVLKESENKTYVGYAVSIERRVKQMQEDAAVVAQAEVAVAGFETELAVFQQRYAEAQAREASATELLALADEIKAVNARIKENKAGFDYASKRYLRTVKELPPLLEAVYGTSVPAELKRHAQLSETRASVLSLVLESRMAAA